MSLDSEPLTYWKPLLLARPICGTSKPTTEFSIPLTEVALSYKLIALNGSTSPETNPTSGEP